MKRKKLLSLLMTGVLALSMLQDAERQQNREEALRLKKRLRIRKPLRARQKQVPNRKLKVLRSLWKSPLKSAYTAAAAIHP